MPARNEDTKQNRPPEAADEGAVTGNGPAELEEAESPAAAPGSEAPGPQREAAETQDRLLRLAAEFDNYRKRMERERAESWQRAQAQLAERLLEPLDDLQRFTASDGSGLSVESVLEGVRLVERKILRSLEAAGLEPLDAEGAAFDPSVHEALGTVATDDRAADESVADVFQRGYRFKGTLLRPARVRVYRFEE
ncbi:MAG: nucleotide exchange factor GrpE [Gemmatimonadota bacterium]|jgi:molecular chaperone GrpE|nr:nucleotide exchange factor GrpE [Gemmatimonadota bacterium]